MEKHQFFIRKTDPRLSSNYRSFDCGIPKLSFVGYVVFYGEGAAQGAVKDEIVSSVEDGTFFESLGSLRFFF